MAQTPLKRPHPQSAPGDFYVVNGECVSCGVPQVVAPALMGWADASKDHCILKKQPETAEELEQAIAVFEAQDLGCHRYAGVDPAILSRISPEYCDRPTNPYRFFTFQDSVPNGFLAWYGKSEGGFFRRFWHRFFSQTK